MEIVLPDFAAGAVQYTGNSTHTEGALHNMMQNHDADQMPHTSMIKTMHPQFGQSMVVLGLRPPQNSERE
jgi:hypothetical protein